MHNAPGGAVGINPSLIGDDFRSALQTGRQDSLHAVIQPGVITGERWIAAFAHLGSRYGGFCHGLEAQIIEIALLSIECGRRNPVTPPGRTGSDTQRHDASSPAAAGSFAVRNTRITVNYILLFYRAKRSWCIPERKIDFLTSLQVETIIVSGRRRCRRTRGGGSLVATKGGVDRPGRFRAPEQPTICGRGRAGPGGEKL